MLRILCAAVVAAFVLVLSIPALACTVPLAFAEAQVRMAVPPAALEIERRDGPAARAALARLNAEPPATDFAADVLVIAYWRGRPGALVLLGLDGCLAGQVTLPAARARLLFGEPL
jgi:hypothetical protein